MNLNILYIQSLRRFDKDNQKHVLNLLMVFRIIKDLRHLLYIYH